MNDLPGPTSTPAHAAATQRDPQRSGCLWRTLKVGCLTVLIAALVVAGLIAWGWNRLTSRPEWWSAAEPRSQVTAAQATEFENWVVKELHTVRPANQREFVLELREDDINAWLAARLAPWARNQSPTDILGREDVVTEFNVKVEADRIWIGTHLAGADAGGFEKRIGIAVQPAVSPEGGLTTRVVDASVGNFNFGQGGVSWVLGLLPGGGDARLNAVLKGSGGGLNTRVKLANGVSVRIRQIELVPGDAQGPGRVRVRVATKP